MVLLPTLKYSAPARENSNPSSPQCIRQVCQAPSTSPGIDLPSHVLPLEAACTVVPGAQLPLPYRSKMSTSPSGSGSSLTPQNDGHRPGNRQSSLIFASQGLLIMLRKLPRRLSLSYV